MRKYYNILKEKVNVGNGVCYKITKELLRSVLGIKIL